MSNNKIFVSYRRQDASGEAGRLVDHLQEVFGESSVFLDVETLEAGLDFVQAINKALNSCKVLIAMIGPHWASIKDSEGNLRLFKDDDFIKIEIAAALERDIRVIPVLVNGATMPSADQLPDSLKALTRRHAHELSSSRWKYDSEQLTEVLKKIIGFQEQPKPFPIPDPPLKKPKTPRQKNWLEKNYLWLLGGVVIILIIANLGGGNSSEDDWNQPDYSGLIDDTENGGNSSDFNLPEGGSSETPPVQQDPIFLDLSGYWLLTDTQGNQSTLYFTQSADEFSFVEYNAFDMEVGTGQGYVNGSNMYSDYYNSAVGISGELTLASSNSGRTWNGKVTFPSLGTSNQITLRRD